MMKRYGNKGSPCLRPKDEPKKPWGRRLMRTEPLKVQTHSLIMEIQSSEKLKNFRAAKRGPFQFVKSFRYVQFEAESPFL